MFFFIQQKCNASPNDFLLRQANFAGCLPWSFPERGFVANFNAYTGDLTSDTGNRDFAGMRDLLLVSQTTPYNREIPRL